jgi:hypothetical protein
MYIQNKEELKISSLRGTCIPGKCFSISLMLKGKGAILLSGYCKIAIN